MPALLGRNVSFEICNVGQYLNPFALGHTVQSASGGASSRFRFNFNEKGARWAILNAWVGEEFLDVAVKHEIQSGHQIKSSSQVTVTSNSAHHQ
jgi:hypothetical protein